MRLPITPQVSTKDGTSNKNSRLTNCLKETKKSGEKVVIRPGLVLEVESSGNGCGLVAFNDELVSIYGSTLGKGVSSTGGVADVGAVISGQSTPPEVFALVFAWSECVIFMYDNDTLEPYTYVFDPELATCTIVDYGFYSVAAPYMAICSPTACVVISDALFGLEIQRSDLISPSFSVVKTSATYGPGETTGVYANSTFVVTTSNQTTTSRIYKSLDDGVTWSTVDISGVFLHGVVWTGTQWIFYGTDFITGTNPTSRTSTDLTSFATTSVSGLSPDYIPRHVRFFDGVYYAICYSASQTDYRKLYTSSDGFSWVEDTSLTYPAPLALEILDGVLWLMSTTLESVLPPTSRYLYKRQAGGSWELLDWVVGEVPGTSVGTASLVTGGSYIFNPGIDTINGVIEVATVPDVISTILPGIYDFAQSPI